MFCNKCKQKLPDDSEFCQYCGSKIEHAESVEVPGTTPDEATIAEYADPATEKYQKMVDKICELMHFTTLRYPTVDDLVEATGLPKERLCTYCWDGKE